MGELVQWVGGQMKTQRWMHAQGNLPYLETATCHTRKVQPAIVGNLPEEEIVQSISSQFDSS